MRLLNTTTLEFEEFMDPKQVKYSILSHCWSQNSQNPEVTHQAFLSGSYKVDGAGYQKILRCCELSKSRGEKYTWIDTCCVDKTSSAELSETINSSFVLPVFAWYQDSAECYVFMDDLAVESLPEIDEIDTEGRWRQGLGHANITDVTAFTENRWFSRGWTLQELLAPGSVLFYNHDTRYLGTKSDLAPLISHATGIHIPVIKGVERVIDASIARRMSWASARRTTRQEDTAYCLLGIFDVNMPLLYGEGQNAFKRLQEAIIRLSRDQSIFAWGLNDHQPYLKSVLAHTPSAFRGSGNITNLYDVDLIERRSLDRVGLSRHNGNAFADMESFDLVKDGVEIRHRNVMLAPRKPKELDMVTLTLNCYDMRGKTPDTIVNVRLHLQSEVYYGGWRRARITHGDTPGSQTRPGLHLYARLAPPRVLYATLRDDLNFTKCISRDVVWDWSAMAWITLWIMMIPTKTLAIVAFAILLEHNNVRDTDMDVGWVDMVWCWVGILALCAGTGQFVARSV
ncbi:hypothetical protein LTR15_004542 [Elasticomyces elasticus]|nr:hypothetical protein LTR15_004542 [Elasticomyces elasticus]